MCRVAQVWCFVLLVGLPALAGAQQILSVSTGSTCVQIPRNGQQFNCDENPNVFKTTVMNVLINPNSAGNNTVSFDVSLTSLPQFGGTQLGTADTCTDPDILGRCTAASNATISYSATPTTLIYSLTPLYIDVPFAYLSETVTEPIFTNQACTEDQFKFTDTTKVGLEDFQIQSGLVANINHLANVSFRAAAWLGPEANRFFRCAPSDYPLERLYPYPVTDPGLPTSRPPAPYTSIYSPSLDSPGSTTNYASATWFQSNAGNCQARTTSAAVQAGPTCQVFRVNPRATLSSKLTVTITTNNQTRTLVLPNVGVGSTQSTGDFLVSVQDLTTPNGFYGPYVPGYVVICGKSIDSIRNFTMVPPGADPGINPWRAFEDPSFRMFTPENTAFMRGSTDPDYYSFPYFIDNVVGQALGNQCTQLGFTPSFASRVTVTSLYSRIAGKVGVDNHGTTVTLPYASAKRAILTCAPQFPDTYLSLPLVTPCQAETQMYKGNLDPTFVPNGILPQFFNRAKPNIWFTPGEMRVELPNTIQVRAVMAFNGNLVAARGTVNNGAFDVAGCACIVDSNPAAKNSSLYFQVCNKSSFESSYIISSTCVPGLTPASGGSVTTKPIPAQACALTEIPLTVGVVPAGATCDGTLLPLNAELNINNVKTSTIELTCVVVSSFVPPAVQKPADIVNFDIWAVPTPIPDKMVETSETEYDLVSILIYSVVGLFIALFLGLVVGLIVVTIKTNKDKEAVKRLMQNSY